MILFFTALFGAEVLSASDSWGDVTNESFKIQVKDFTPGGTQFL